MAGHLRIRKRLRLRRWLYLNLAKRGASLSVARRGLALNISRHGLRLTVGLHGSGITYQRHWPWRTVRQTAQQLITRKEKPS